MLSSPKRIEEPQAAAALCDSKLRRLVLAFVGDARSIGEVASRSGVELKQLHHHVMRLCRLGLLTVAGERKRQGRPIKLYKAVSDSFFVPFDAAPELFTEGLSRELRECIRHEHLRRGDGALLGVDPNGVPMLRFVAEDHGPGSGAELWQILRLEAGEAKALRRELRELLDRHAAQASGRGKPYLVHCAVAQRIAETVSVDNPPRDRNRA